MLFDTRKCSYGDGWIRILLCLLYLPARRPSPFRCARRKSCPSSEGGKQRSRDRGTPRWRRCRGWRRRPRESPPRSKYTKRFQQLHEGVPAGRYCTSKGLPLVESFAAGIMYSTQLTQLSKRLTCQNCKLTRQYCLLGPAIHQLRSRCCSPLGFTCL